MVVADGMEVALGGEKASALRSRPSRTSRSTPSSGSSTSTAQEHALLAELRAGIERADRTVIEKARSDPRLYGMGTTLTMAFSVGTDLYLVHAGDSRDLFHDGELQQVTEDHNLAQLLANHGAIRPEEARRHRRRNVLTNVIGGPSAGVNVEVHKLEISDGDVLLLCSDGLTEPVDNPSIARVLGEITDPKAACDRLIKLALERGAPDNVTIVLARYETI